MDLVCDSFRSRSLLGWRPGSRFRRDGTRWAATGAIGPLLCEVVGVNLRVSLGEAACRRRRVVGGFDSGGRLGDLDRGL